LEAVVKIIRNQGNMRRVSMRELEVLKVLHDEDVHPNIVKLIDDFDYHNHLCFVLEPMSQDLELSIYGARKGVHGRSLGVAATRRFSRHIFRGLRHMRKKGIIHGDLKPANILVDAKSSILKLCDFGQVTQHPHICTLTSTCLRRHTSAQRNHTWRSTWAACGIVPPR